MSKRYAFLLLPAFLGILLVALVLRVGDTGAEALAPGFEINGLFWGDQDYQDYTLWSSALGDRGFLYLNRVAPDRLNVLVRMSYAVNDNVFSPTKTSYVADIGLEEGFMDLGWNPGHDLQDLVSLDHLELFMRCGAGSEAWTYSWIQDLVYDANNANPELPDPNYDWRSDQFGPDSLPGGVGVVSSDPINHPVPASGIIMTSHSSLEYNLENSSWIVINETGQSTNYNDWMSPDLSPIGTISLTIPPTDVNAMTEVHEDYPFFVSTGAAPTDLFEWSISYEMVLDISPCVEAGEATYIGVPGAHNSPSKDGNEVVEIPTAIRLSEFRVGDYRPSAPLTFIAVGLLVMVTLAIMIRGLRQSKR
jgi:hypothetical protein